jgi:hypothetical protein
MSNAGIRKVLWWVCLVAAPAVLISLELFHPAHFTADPGMFAFLSKPHAYDAHFVALGYPGPEWWFTLHFIQTPVVALVAVGLWLLAGKVDDADGMLPLILAWLSRAATLTFLIYYTALDSIGGTGLARLLLNTQALVEAGKLTPAQVEGVALVLNTTWVDAWVGGVGSFISETGSWAVLAAVVFALAALLLARKAPWPPLIVLLAFGWQLETAHASPHGPIAFALLIVAAIWLWWAERNAAHRTFTAEDLRG